MGNIIDQVVALVDDFELASIFPALDTVIGWVTLFAWLCALAAPVTMLVLGLRYRYSPPEKANYRSGYRFFFGMGSQEAWKYTQQLAGVVWTLLGGGMTVIMLIVCLFFGLMNPVTMVSVVLWSVGIQLVLIVTGCVVINKKVADRFDKDGNPKR